MDKFRISRRRTRLEKFRRIRRRTRIGLVCSIVSAAALFLFVLTAFLLSVIRPPVLAISPLWDGTAAGSFSGGSGAENDPYLIATAEQLAYFSQQANAGTTYSGKYIKLTQDILLNEMQPNGTFVSGNPRKFTSIGSSANKFAGHFDGDGYEVVGLYVNNEGNGDYQGLFGYADTGSVIEKIKISGSVKGGNRSGGVAGFTNGLISECTVNVSILASWKDYHGAVAGEAGVNSVISHCSASGKVEGTQYVGAIVGYTSGKVTESDADDIVLTGQEYVGGIVGWAYGTGSEISNIHFSGTASANGNYIGGIAGRLDGTITGCTVDATITGQEYVGGIAGWASGTDSVISNCSFSGSTTANGNYIGGIAGRADGTINGCTVDATITGKSGYTGGIVGWAYGPDSVISNCTFTGAATVTANSNYLGGIAGRVDGTITQSTVDAAITGQSGYVGGIAGWAGTGSMISNTSSGGSVTGKSGGVGGIAGYTDGTVKISINTGTVQSNTGNTGGIAGEAGNNGVVSNSFNSGEIINNGGSYYGGIVGYVGSDTQIHHNLNMGEVGGTQNVGSVTGNTPGSGNTWNNYYNDYQGSPGGTNGGDIHTGDGAVPIGNLEWEQIQELLNTNNDDGDDVWNQDLDDNGVTKPGSGTDPVSTPTAITSAIKEGKRYTADALGSGTAIDVTSDSVFTVRYTLEYGAACEPKNHTLRLVDSNGSTALPMGTSITMLAGGAYYYINLAAPAAAVALSDFVKMGSADSHYNPAPAGAGDTDAYLFIFDFTNIPAENQLPAASYQVELNTPAVGYTGGLPAVTITGRNNYELSASGELNLFTISLAITPVAGYDYKTDGKALVYEFHLEKTEDDVTETFDLPVGTKINGNLVSSALPYAFVPVDLEHTSTITLDMSGSVDPIPSGEYTLHVILYSCTDITKPQNGYMLDSSTTNISLAAPTGYAIKAAAPTRLFDRSAGSINVAFHIETQGSGVVKSTLQRKYGDSYVNIDGQVNLPAAIAGEGATLSLPADTPKGTYRFQLTLYDVHGTEQAKDVVNVIIK